MGYYTNYDLTWDAPESSADIDTNEEIIKAFGKLPYFEGYAFDDYGSGIYIGSVKWYDHMDDMYKLSKQFPDVLFHLWGDGENADDLWMEHWQNGKVQECAAVIPPFERSAMTEYKPTKL